MLSHYKKTGAIAPAWGKDQQRKYEAPRVNRSQRYSDKVEARKEVEMEHMHIWEYDAGDYSVGIWPAYVCVAGCGECDVVWEEETDGMGWMSPAEYQRTLLERQMSNEMEDRALDYYRED